MSFEITYVPQKLCPNLQKHIDDHASLLKMKCTLYLEDDTPLYYVESSYIGEKDFFSASIPR